MVKQPAFTSTSFDQLGSRGATNLGNGRVRQVARQGRSASRSLFFLRGSCQIGSALGSNDPSFYLLGSFLPPIEAAEVEATRQLRQAHEDGNAALLGVAVRDPSQSHSWFQQPAAPSSSLSDRPQKQCARTGDCTTCICALPPNLRNRLAKVTSWIQETSRPRKSKTGISFRGQGITARRSGDEAVG